ncbi:hypothetical protein FSP39_001363 [Pinctada imbricata]|uniref:Inositol-1-monophosphatase n=1 Tax=Pinctada imbricata TaxID=66713 RepID=A0AA88XQ00_PINIB|nr:hypothetical protein FSP39_001363 [Pinctada imbricata]
MLEWKKPLQNGGSHLSLRDTLAKRGRGSADAATVKFQKKEDIQPVLVAAVKSPFNRTYSKKQQNHSCLKLYIKAMDHNLQSYFDTALDIAKKAGEMVKEAFYKEKTLDTKESFADIVTETDQAVERFIINSIKEKYPTHKFIGEESVSGGQKCDWTDSPTWIIDPIDGTSNFVHGIPQNCVCIGLSIDKKIGEESVSGGQKCDWTDSPTWIIDPIDGTSNFVHGIPQNCVCIGLSIDKKIALGIVHLPITNQTFSAIKGQGAYCNGDKIHTSRQTDLKKCVIITEAGNSRDPNVVNTKMENIRRLVQETHGIRMIGSAAVDMCMIASGSGDAYVEYGIHIWDIAAAGIILEEAGGCLIDPAGGPVDYQSRRVLAGCTETVAQQLSSILTHLEMERD